MLEGFQACEEGPYDLLVLGGFDADRLRGSVDVIRGGDGQSTVAEFAPLAAEMSAKGTPVNFVALKKGTVVWPGLSDDSGSNHICTWRAAYTIEGIRDWLFQQKK
ncbi:hypothetical protein [Streptomyces sp. NPDC000888]